VSEHPRTFTPFGHVHQTALLVSFLITVVVFIIGWRIDATSQTWRTCLFLFALAVAIPNELICLMPGNFSWAESLPFHYCDWNMVFACVVLRAPQKYRSIRVLLFFWGVSVSVFGVILPRIEHGPESPRWWLFWISHWLLPAVPIYDVVIRGLRITFTDFAWFIFTANNIYIGMFTFNALTGFNYMYSGANSPLVPSHFIQIFGEDWPMRAVKLYWSYVVIFTVIYGVVFRLICPPPPPPTDNIAHDDATTQRKKNEKRKAA
jgi:hypothetical integral membrane protein (TIGR02206 family)